MRFALDKWAIKQKLTNKCITAAGAAAIVGTSPTHFRQIMLNVYVPNVLLAVRIAHLFDSTVEQLFLEDAKTKKSKTRK
jgi:DNA-binding XRE family transcriptional regulator